MVFLDTCRAVIVLGLPYSKGVLMRGGLRVLLGGLGRKRLPDTVRPNGRVRCTKCAIGLMTRVASRVVVGFLVMMMSIKALLVAQWIGLSCAGTLVNSHVQALVLQAHLNVPEIAKLTMSRRALTVRWNGLVYHIAPTRGPH